MQKFVVTTFYKFINLPNIQEIKLAMYKFCKENNILGTALLAEEGINSTFTGPRESIDAFYSFMDTLPAFKGLEYKESFCDVAPFEKLKIKIKPEIIKFDTSVDGKLAGERLSPKDWEKLIDDGVPMIDTRNDYEVIFGTFKNAIDPQIRNFTELADWLDINLRDHDREKPVAMFCTGGVRCEKSTAYLLKKGFKKVYHLDGGIIKYFMESDRKRDYWNGQCFVFDDRIAIDHDLKPYADCR